MIWNAHYECMEREELRELQGERLQAMVEKVYFNVPFYRLKLQEKGIEPGDIRSIDDLRNILHPDDAVALGGDHDIAH
jgi:phenylacetate-CoA ligase